jgi:hypothetical protein
MRRGRAGVGGGRFEASRACNCGAEAFVGVSVTLYPSLASVWWLSRTSFTHFIGILLSVCSGGTEGTLQTVLAVATPQGKSCS